MVVCKPTIRSPQLEASESRRDHENHANRNIFIQKVEPRNIKKLTKVQVQQSAYNKPTQWKGWGNEITM
jgi:ribosomal protein S10